MILTIPKRSKTLQKLDDFLSLEVGWHFGQGQPPEQDVFDIAHCLVTHAEIYTFETDVFPGIDGEIMVTVYADAHYLEFTIQTDGAITYVYQVEEKDVSYEEGLTLGEAMNNLDNFFKTSCNISEFYTVSTTTPENVGSKVWHFTTQPRVEYRLYQQNALTELALRSVNTSSNSIREQHRSPQYSGSSPVTIFPFSILSNNLRAIQGMSAMKI